MRNLWHVLRMDMPSFITQTWQAPRFNQTRLSFLGHVSLPSMLLFSSFRLSDVCFPWCQSSLPCTDSPGYDMIMHNEWPL